MKPLIYILFCLLSFQVFAQEPVWMQLENKYPYGGGGINVNIDLNDNIYIVSDWGLAGSYSRPSKIIKYTSDGEKEWEYDWYVDSASTSGISSNKFGNTFIVKSWSPYLHFTKILSLDGEGNEIFSKRLQGLNFNDVICDINNNSYVTGFSFYPNYEDEMLLMKFDPSGNIEWQTFWKIPDHTIIGKRILLDEDSNIYVAGSFHYPGLSSLFIAKFNSNGVLLNYSLFLIDNGYWYKSLFRFSIDSDNNLYVTGRFEEDEFWDKYGVIYKFDSALTKQWHDSTSLHFHTFYDLVVDDDKNIILSGSECHDFYDYPHAIYAKYNENGTKLWHYTNDSIRSSLGSISMKSNNYFLSGRLENIEKDNFEIITVQLNSNGQVTWSHIIEGMDNTFSYGSDNVIDNSGDLICTGTYRDTTLNCLTIKYDAITFEEEIFVDHPYEIYIYPNPAKTLINIELGTKYPTPNEISIFTMDGREIKEKKFKEIGSDNIQLDISEIASGIYILSVKYSDKIISEKVIITD